MAETPDGMEKSEQATPKRLKDAQERGQVSKSNDVTTAAIILIGGMMIFLYGPSITGNLQGFMHGIFANLATTEITENNIQHQFASLILFLAKVLLPLVLTIFAIATLGDVAQVGFHFATKKFTEGLKWEQVFNPFKGMKRMFFSSYSFVELIKSFLKLGVLGILIYNILYKKDEELIGLLDRPFIDVSNFMISVAYELIWKVGLAYALIALADYLYQKWKFQEDMKMTKTELKDENKQTEGDPLMKSKIRSMMRGRIRQLMMKNVPTADVIITNPTHFAVAIKYTPGEMGAPKVVAKGIDFLALKIREIAKENDVPIVEDPPLARNIYWNVEYDQEINESMFKAVAQVLAYVYNLKTQESE